MKGHSEWTPLWERRYVKPLILPIHFVVHSISLDVKNVCLTISHCRVVNQA